MRLANARLAGLLYLVIFVFGLFSEGVVRAGVTVAGDPAATAANILASEGLFRAGFALNLVYLLGEVALVIILYRLFEPVNRDVSLLAAAFRLACVVISALNLLNMFNALLAARDGDGRALYFLDLHGYGYGIALAFFAVNCALMGYLTIRSGRVPRTLGALLAVAGLAYLVNSFLLFLVPDYRLFPPLLAPAVVAEGWFTLLLLRRGGGPERWSTAAAEAVPVR
ncbi:DUF4386 domain-containing protein [Phytohabitans sp. ZYX-F-186]|uniref:DUF4386 domain-containing protein n=1 Tax=Phytohabitans maris TaxID=3071409 RepID=A0ABU0ZQG3_9ACTN|nr:DUF4386 domain-containing protein [Phytohabitans sp. ZYX-F-186]MDQ7908152.1 DUF4386 domain-containing protein [Phytohabitans sp. ZYX-F-186]